ncbi:hypothetical protein LE181_16695 [Streptomyces sp. SCA3-4]|uniref:hypothetical protein n=1 Tax=Streptomyces sichuanensis TaxID=2871810 RepID=UPI001CE34C4C|nr:hypothetical protein [Streptomyces sichuanensis]MCA6093793.1 hypothetical protein [Streptomyces sichuanensis]
MVFGRNRNGEPPLAVIDWRGVHRFSIDIVERETGPQRKRPVLGPNAVRVPRREGQDRVKAPCAFFRSAVVGVRDVGRVLYEDREAQHVLCTIEECDAEGDERRYSVRDGQGREIGVIRRVPPSRKLLRHTWRIQQAGHPEIVGRNKWAAIAPKEVAARAAGKFLGELVDSALSLGHDDGQVKERTLLWLAGEEQVMQSVGQEFQIKAGWLDRRLAFAVATFADR